MAKEVYWTKFAVNKLDDIFAYYKLTASYSVSKNIVDELIDKTIGLENNPLIGQKEILLEDRIEKFRYLVCKNHKIIYWINSSKNRIEVVHVFDTRQNPKKIEQF